MTYIEELLLKILVTGTVFATVLFIFNMRELKKSRKKNVDKEGS